jgi:hypothetical protein
LHILKKTTVKKKETGLTLVVKDLVFNTQQFLNDGKERKKSSKALW